MAPKTIVSGFRTCGVYPFSPKAVLDHDPCTVSKLLDENPPDAVDHDKTSTDSPVNPPPVFSPEDKQRFQTRYEEGFDLFNDPEYITWLEINHPDALPVNDPLTTDPFESSMTDFFPDVSPMEEMTCSQSPPGQSSVSLPDVSLVNSVPQVQSSIAPLLASDVGDSANKPDVANNPAKADVMMTVKPLSTPQSSVVPTTPKSGYSIGSTPGSGQSSSAESTDVISKYLVQCVPATPRSRNQSVDRVTGSRVLTSSEGLAMLKEKEDKKKRKRRCLRGRKGRKKGKNWQRKRQNQG